MSTFRAQITINAPASTIYPYLTDNEKITQWVKMMNNRETVSQGEFGEGTQLRASYSVPNNDNFQTQIEVRAHQPPTRLQMHETSEGFDSTHTYTLRESNGRTELTYSGDTKYKGFIPRLMAPIVNIMARREMKQEFARLKELAEGDSGS
jgi:uncharacterized protein YndB with AHSA1/START domain